MMQIRALKMLQLNLLHKKGYMYPNFSAYLDVLFMSGHEAIPAVCAGAPPPAGLAPLHLPHLRPRRHRHSWLSNKLPGKIFLALRNKLLPCRRRSASSRGGAAHHARARPASGGGCLLRGKSKIKEGSRVLETMALK